MKGRPTINIPTSANPSSQSLGLPQQHVIKKPNGDHVKHLVGRARQACPVTGQQVRPCFAHKIAGAGAGAGAGDG
jgi:hypothetical protein